MPRHLLFLCLTHTVAGLNCFSWLNSIPLFEHNEFFCLSRRSAFYCINPGPWASPSLFCDGCECCSCMMSSSVPASLWNPQILPTQTNGKEALGGWGESTWEKHPVLACDHPCGLGWSYILPESTTPRPCNNSFPHGATSACTQWNLVVDPGPLLVTTVKTLVIQLGAV